MQNLLLGLGSGLVVVAAMVFMAVTWSRLGALTQGVILLAITAAAGGAMTVCVRRRMPATAEALGLVAASLALADAHAIRIGAAPGLDPQGYWAGALAVVAVTAWTAGAAAGVRSSRAVAAVVAPLPLFFVLSATDATLTTALLLALAQAATMAVLADRWVSAPRVARVLAAVAALLTWSGVTAIAFLDAVLSDAFDSSADPWGAIAVLVASSAVAAGVAWLRADQDGDRNASLVAATMVGLAASWLAIPELVSPRLVDEVGGLLAVAVVAVGLRVAPRWGRAPAAVGGVNAGLVALGLVAPLATAVGAATRVAADAWDIPGTAPVTSFVPVALSAPDAGPLALMLAVLVGLLVAALPLLRRGRLIAVASVGLVAVALTPFVFSLSVGGAMAVAVAGAAVFVGLGALAPRDPDRPARGLFVGAAFAAPCAVLGLAWGAAAEATTLAAVGAVTVLAGAQTLLARSRRTASLASAGAVATVVGAASLAGLSMAAVDVGAAPSWAAGGIAALVLGLVVALALDPEGTGDSGDAVLSLVAESTAWAVHGVALYATVAIGDRSAISLALATGAVAGGLHAVRQGRRPFAFVGAGHALVLVWLRLADAHVAAPEPYALPLAAVLLAAGLVAERRIAAQDGPDAPVPSWVTLGPALVVAFVPTVVAALSDPGLVRPLVALGAGAVVLAAGALAGRRAPVDVGTGVVVLLGLRQLGPVVTGLPNWVTLGSAGLLLLAVGATFEQRRRDLDDVRHRYGSLT